MSGDVLDDEYVANLLKEDAKKTSRNYRLVGLDAFNPTRPRGSAPKPNTNFLRHIIRQTDSHNAALLAKEAEESRARLKHMDRGRNREEKEADRRKSRKSEGRLTPITSEGEGEDKRSRKRKGTHTEREDDRGSRRRWKDRDEHRSSRSRRDRSRSRDRHKERQVHEDDEDTRTGSRHSRHGHKERRHRHRSEEHERTDKHEKSRHRHTRRRSRSRSRSPQRSPSPRTSKHHRKSRRKSRSPSPWKALKKRSRSVSEGEDTSDPLEGIVRTRGRGAHKAKSMGINARFSSTYDPSIDVAGNSDEDDDWGDALEALRNRQQWVKQGAERLRAAGFTDEQVSIWENGDKKTEEDVVWTTKGQAREWDRGKVVDEDGDVDLKAEWGRLT